MAANQKITNPFVTKEEIHRVLARVAGQALAMKSSDNEAIAQLTEDHARVKEMFEQYDALAEAEAWDESERQELATMICAELTAHATAEEEIFYPAAREVLDDGDLIDEAEVEHASAKDLIAQIPGFQPGGRTFRCEGEGARRVHQPPRRRGRGRDFPQSA